MERNQLATLSKSSRMMQGMIFKLLSTIQYGQLTVTDETGRYQFKGSSDVGSESVSMQIHRVDFYKKLCLSGSLGAAESYIDGEWDTDNLTKLIELIIRNKNIFNHLEGPSAKLLNGIQALINLFRANDIVNAKKNILAHYDLGNDFFKLFLDPTMMYSCALYEPEHIELEQASLNKLDNICQQLQLKPTDHLLEIGTGWGGLAIYAASKFGCKVTTTTISDKQFAYAKREIERLGLQNQIELLNVDYRQLSGQYDKLVSIEMIEAVGEKYFNTFFRQCNALLKPGGLFFLQAITINDQAYHATKSSVDFIKKYIFPGGCLPSVNLISNCIAQQTQMHLLQMRDIGQHYATTLLDWLKRFNQQIDQIRAQGFSEEFIRTWRYYFCYCAAGFKQSYIGDIQGLWRKQDV